MFRKNLILVILLKIWLLGKSTECIYKEGEGEGDVEDSYELVGSLENSNNVFIQQFKIEASVVNLHSIEIYFKGALNSSVSEGSISLTTYFLPLENCDYAPSYPYGYDTGSFLETSIVSYPPASSVGLQPITFPLLGNIYPSTYCYSFLFHTYSTISTNAYSFAVDGECGTTAMGCWQTNMAGDYSVGCDSCYNSVIYKLNGTTTDDGYCLEPFKYAGFLVALGFAVGCSLCVCRLGPKLGSPGSYNIFTKGIFAKILTLLDVIGKLVSECYNVAYIVLVVYHVWLYCNGWIQFYLTQALLFEFISCLANLLMLVDQLGDYADSNAVLLKLIIMISQCFSFAVAGAIVAETYVSVHWLYRCARACFILWWLAPWITRGRPNVAFAYFMLFFVASIVFGIFSFIVTGKSLETFVDDKSNFGRTIDVTLHWSYIVCKCLFAVLAILKSIIKALWKRKLNEYIELLRLRLELEFLGIFILAWNRIQYDEELNQLYISVVDAVDKKLADLHDIIY